MTAGLNPPSHRLSVAVTGCKRSKAGAGGKISGVSGNPYGADDFMVGRTNAFAVNCEPGTSRGTGGPPSDMPAAIDRLGADSPTHGLIPIRSPTVAEEQISRPVTTK